MVYSWLRSALFCLPPQWSDDAGLYGLKWLSMLGLTSTLFKQPKDNPIELFGLRFKNRIGIAAGLDCDGEFMHALASLGVGHIEVGGVTPIAQEGNPSPWLFRLPKHHAIINRKGFRNKGVDNLARNLADKPKQCVIGVNITKNKATPLNDAFTDYAYCMRALNKHADYLAINISSPNTPGLRELQNEQYLDDLLAQCKALQKELPRAVPLLVKISPDLDDDQLHTLAQCCLRQNIDGLIATNTTIDRESIKDDALAEEQGGLSGAPLTVKSTTVIKKLYEIVQDDIPIMGAGGIMTADDASDKFNAGAKMVQIYTGLIYSGPELITNIT